jgi:hypothetical protein
MKTAANAMNTPYTARFTRLASGFGVLVTRSRGVCCRRMRRKLDGQVAVVAGGGEGTARSVALLLAARGARVVVTGKDERALGETVGEIAHGGGQARHVVTEDLGPAVERALSVFGRVDVVVAASAPSAPVDCNVLVFEANATPDHVAALAAALCGTDEIAGATITIR